MALKISTILLVVMTSMYLSIIFPDSARLEREEDNNEDEEDHIEQPQQLLLEQGGTCDQSVLC